MSAPISHELVVEPAPVAAGDVVRGRVRGPVPVQVALVRVEQTPVTCVAVELASCSAGAAGVFELEVPVGAAPTAAGERCGLAYAVRVHPPRPLRRGQPASVDVAVTGRLEHVHATSRLHDRLIASYDSRHLHLEPVEADIQGGGAVAGRVHVHQGKPPHSLMVGARCEESWRINYGAWGATRAPLWRFSTLWRSASELVWPDDQTWAPFRFELPDSLPPATEGRVLAWRYEIEARRAVRFAPDERAVITPIGFELV